MIDEQDWTLGMYIGNAVSVAIEHNFAGRKARSKYIEKPFLRDDKLESEKLSEDDLQKKREAFMAQLNVMKANFDIEKAKKQKEGEHGD